MYRESARNLMRLNRCVSAVRAVEASAFFCSRDSRNYVPEVGGPKDLCDSPRSLSCEMSGTYWI